MQDSEQVDAVAGIVQRLVGDDLVGLYLGGSSVEGGLRPASDLDLLAVLQRPLSPGARLALAQQVMAVSGRRVGGRPLELTAVVRAQVVPWRYPPAGEFQYGDWLAEAVGRGEVDAPGPMPGLAVELTQVRRSGRAVVGPPPGSVLAPVPAKDVALSCRDAVPGLLADLHGDERNVLLTFARIWCTLITGEVRTKDDAAAWALPRLPDGLRPVLAHARDLYRTTTYADEWWPQGFLEQVPALVQHVLCVLGCEHGGAAGDAGRS